MDNLLTDMNRRFNMTESGYYAGDPRVKDWPFMQGPESMVLLTALYMSFVWYGPFFMAKRQPVKGTGLMVIYNLLMVGLSLYMFVEFFAIGISQGYALLCQPVDYSTTPLGYREASVSWWYFFSKILEYMDTVFFILRKKNGQITFLHVYHHSTMAIICWYVAKYVPGGEKFYSGGLNTLVHVFMYIYYCLAAIGPQMQKYLWWKKYLTTFQMIQFLSVNVRCFVSVVMEPRCLYPRWLNVVAIVYSSSLFCLFSNFYKKSYIGTEGRAPSSTASPQPESRGSNDNRGHTD